MSDLIWAGPDSSLNLPASSVVTIGDGLVVFNMDTGEVTGRITEKTAGEAARLFLSAFRGAMARHDAKVAAGALREAADAEGDWTSRSWRSEEAETVVKLRKGLKARADRIEREAGIR